MISLFISFVAQAQFIDAKPPTSLELELHKAKSIKSLLKIVAESKNQKKYKILQRTLEKIIKIEPNIPLFRFQLAEAYSLNDDKTKAYDALITIQKQGFYFDIEKNENFANIKSFPLFKYIKENMDINGEHHGEGSEAFSLSKSFSGLLFENIAYDEKNQAFLMGSLRDGSIIKISGNGEISVLIEATQGGAKGPWAALDVAVDAKNNVLWVASGSVSQYGKFTKETSGLTGVFKYNLSTGKLLQSVLVPANKRPSLFNSIAVTESGDLFVLGAINNVVLKLAKDATQFSIVFSTKKYKKLRNLTTDETGNIVYINDDDEGIVIISLKDENIYLIGNSPQLNLTGITDLIYDDNGLIMIQSGFTPERIMRLALGKTKLNLENIFPIESAHPRFNSPSAGTVVENGLYFIANSQLTKTNIVGGLIKGQQWDDLFVISADKHYKEAETLAYKQTVKDYGEKMGADEQVK